jgi:hypothetical protein
VPIDILQHRDPAKFVPFLFTPGNAIDEMAEVIALGSHHLAVSPQRRDAGFEGQQIGIGRS